MSRCHTRPHLITRGFHEVLHELIITLTSIHLWASPPTRRVTTTLKRRAWNSFCSRTTTWSMIIDGKEKDLEVTSCHVSSCISRWRSWSNQRAFRISDSKPTSVWSIFIFAWFSWQATVFPPCTIFPIPIYAQDRVDQFSSCQLTFCLEMHSAVGLWHLIWGAFIDHRNSELENTMSVVCTMSASR